MATACPLTFDPKSPMPSRRNPDDGNPEPEADTDGGADATPTADGETGGDPKSAADDSGQDATGGGGTAPPTGPTFGPPEDPRTELQKWTRGTPPFSLVKRSPECADLLAELEPLYDQRADAHGDIIYYGDFTLSDWQLHENKPKLEAAQQSLVDANAAIAVILKRCGWPYEPPSAPAAEDLFPPLEPATTTAGDAAKAVDPATAAGYCSQQSENYLENFAELSGDCKPKLILDVYGSYNVPDVGDFSDDPTGDKTYENYISPIYNRLAEKFGSLDLGLRYDDSAVGSGSGDNSNYFFYGRPNKLLPLQSRLFLGERFSDITSSTDGFSYRPAAGAAFTPAPPLYADTVLPLDGNYQEYELYSARPSNRGFADSQGEWSNFTPRSGSFLLDKLVQRAAWGAAADFAPGGSRDGLNYFMPSYDEGLTGRLQLGQEFFNQTTGDWNFPASPKPEAAPEVDFDLTRFRMGYSLKDRWAAFTLEATPRDGLNATLDGYTGAPVRSLEDLRQAELNKVSADWRANLTGAWSEGGRLNFNFNYSEALRPAGEPMIGGLGGIQINNDLCATEAFPVNVATAAHQNGQRVHDQWATRAIGFTPDKDSAAGLLNDDAQPVVVAVIDTGLDWHHLDFSWDNLWRNADEIPENGIDDDNNGFVDDIFGWDFLAGDNRPWDNDGHGTFVTGLIAATPDNRAGIDGINPNARIMVLKALNNFGHTRASWLAQAVIYAVDNGARIINLSAAGPGLPQVVQNALDYADARGVLVVVAAGNSGSNIAEVQPAGLMHALTVAATGIDGERAAFSNWGASIALAAPGVQVMSLRARQTDFRMTSADTPYVPGSGMVGLDRRYYRADGTSFAAPLVTGVASLIWSNNPELTHVQVRRMLEQSARDIDAAGRDQFTGYGLLDARAALQADPDYFILANIAGVAVASIDGKPVAQVTGTADADKLDKVTLEIGSGDNPQKWKRVGKSFKQGLVNNVLGNIPASELQGSPVWTVRIVVKHRDGSEREARYTLNIG